MFLSFALTALAAPGPALTNRTERLEWFRDQGFGNETAHVYLEQNLTTHPTYVRKRAKGRVSAARSHPKPKPAAIEPGDH